MVKAKKFLRKQADKAELMARSSKDVEVAQDFANLARAFRSQAALTSEARKVDVMQEINDAINFAGSTLEHLPLQTYATGLFVLWWCVSISWRSGFPEEIGPFAATSRRVKARRPPFAIG